MSRTILIIALVSISAGNNEMSAGDRRENSNPDDFAQIARTMDSVFPAGSWLELAAQHRWLGSGPVTEEEARERIRARHHHPFKRVIRMLTYNTYLLDGLQLPFPTTPSVQALLGAKPLLRQRATEIGLATSSQFDVVALSEVFGDREKQLIRAAWRSSSEALGPGRGDDGLTTSGLYTLSKFPIRRFKTHFYRSRGDRLVDPDAWANKGVLMVEIDLGFPDSALEIYSTHLFAGGGLPTSSVPQAASQAATVLERAAKKIPWLRKPAREVEHLARKTSDVSQKQRKYSIRNQQIAELIDFYRRTHSPRNVAIIVGDFNVSAEDAGQPTKQYGQLVQAMSEIAFYDLWPSRSASRGSTSNLLHFGREICETARDGTAFCDEKADDRAGNRIDYIFVQRPAPQHGFALDFTRPRRHAFPRNQAADGYTEIPYMSDHIGLAVNLIATPVRSD